MTLRVDSEIGRLRRVLVHRPGQEIEWMVPAMMERLLFDDILDLKQAQREHDTFRTVLQAAGVETLDPQDLLTEIFDRDDVREQALAALQAQYGLKAEVCKVMADLESSQLAATLIRGRRHDGYPVVGRRRSFFELAPVPNYFFQRDPQVVMGDRVILSAMATEAREREPFIARLIFEHHPALQGHSERFQLDADWPTSWDAEREIEFPYPELEGGDVLVVSPEVVMVGVSARTNLQGVELLAEYLRTHDTTWKHLIVVQLPAQRSFMHLDTVFTFIDHDTCLGYVPVVEAGHTQSARVYYTDLQADELAMSPRGSMVQALAQVGVEVEVVPCGGPDDLIFQQREQWTDGANSFAIAPGVILLYRRNRRTVAELQRRGWRLVTDEDILAGGVDLLNGEKTVISLRDNELSRARGGPHCMTMPIERDVL